MRYPSFVPIIALVTTASVALLLGCRPGEEPVLEPEPLPEVITVTGKVYFTRAAPDQAAIHLHPVERELPSGEDLLFHAVEALLEGPTADERARGIVTAIPLGTELLGVRRDEHIAYLDFDGRVEEGGGTASVLSRVHQILYTATEFPDVDGVVLEIEGERPEAFSPEGLILDFPMRRPPETPTF